MLEIEVRSKEDLRKLSGLKEAVINGVKVDLSLIDGEVLLYLRKSMPEGSILVDLRNNEVFYEKLENLDAFEKGKTYFLVCERGIKSSTLCEMLRDRGIEAYWSIVDDVSK